MNEHGGTSRELRPGRNGKMEFVALEWKEEEKKCGATDRLLWCGDYIFYCGVTTQNSEDAFCMYTNSYDREKQPPAALWRAPSLWEQGQGGKGNWLRQRACILPSPGFLVYLPGGCQPRCWKGSKERPASHQLRELRTQPEKQRWVKSDWLIYMRRLSLIRYNMHIFLNK